MSTEKHSLFDMDGVGLCLSTEAQEVLFQNSVSKDICGDMQGQTCKKCDPEVAPKLGLPLSSESREIDGQNCQLHRIGQGQGKQLTVITLADMTQAELKRYFAKQGLTKRESEVALLLAEQLPNTDIQAKLNISKATLKTHLNHLYKKCPHIKQLRKGQPIHDNPAKKLPLSSL